MKFAKVTLVSVALSLFASAASAASAWPASTTGTQIGSGLSTRNTTTNGFEASGIDYLSGTGYIVVGDDGDIAVLSSTGTVSNYWNRYQATENDFEDVTVTDTSVTDNKMYIANEYSNKIEELYISTGVKTGLSWTLSDLVTNSTTGAGFEALTYVPAAYAPSSWGTAQSGGFFLAASQAENIVRVYTFSRSTSSTVSSVATITLESSYYDIGSLQYNSLTNVLYVVFDADSRVKEYSLTGTLFLQVNGVDPRSYLTPTNGTLGTDNKPASEEGLVIVPNCTTGLAQATLTVDNISSRVTTYNNYPVTCTVATPTVIDEDHDGVVSTSDCNDNDATISSNGTYYRDADGDGLGSSSVTTSVCSLTAPTGYVATATDLNDADYDNDGVITSADCNDADSSVSSYLTVYQDYDGDGLGNPAVSQQVCALTAPTGYVTNASDADDSGVVIVVPPTYSQIEYLNNGVDDDGDGAVDEWNTLSSNGVHPVYGSYDPSSSSLYSQTVTSIAGASNGAIKVKFIDGSGYRYNVLSRGSTTVSSYSGAYLLVRSGKRYALVNAYTGTVLDSLRTTASKRRVSVHLKTLSLHRK